ncbi:circadian clock protein KaiA [Pantanalinema sp. GBBB05]|uniref:circadian clock protein KaiA n=1 Tax=Pantanalinema sp. GBBB05 TaxID=2604139 RepID=UPI001D8EADA9|nr:circadian clock protein KaiA [Pantanalinema sp. GBBB05]
MRPQLFIVTLLTLDSLTQTILKVLGDDRYHVIYAQSQAQFFQLIEQEKHHLDCLILQLNSDLPPIITWLYGQASLLPAVLIDAASGHTTTIPASVEGGDSDRSVPLLELPFTYHTAEVHVTVDQLPEINCYIDQAIRQFLALSPNWRSEPPVMTDLIRDQSTLDVLIREQDRLTEKLKERLGYLGVYYKRNPQNFFRHLPAHQKQELLDKLKLEYRDIILRYFANDGTLNQRIDDFVNTVFFTDIPVAQIVETHMELMDEFSKQLKLEGRSEEILLDYRLTLIDTIAHLCEMYRRSIPRES